MSKKPVLPRAAARRDVEAAVDYYAREAGADVAHGYPCIVFCVEQDHHIDVWRVLHAHRDIAVWMEEPES